ncbi:MAG: Hexokinase [Firmicutes bacterium]|nr:Hexokinase [Bacillota bacterium]
MTDTQAVLQDMREELETDSNSLRKISADFCEEMKISAAGRKSSLQMLPSFLDLPDGFETGRFLALDFGGTNVRAMLVELGNRSSAVLKQRSAPLRDPDGKYDYTAKDSSAEELFDFLARLVSSVAEGELVYYLGHTFSFPCHQTSLSQTKLIRWTKEIATPGVEGQGVGELLQAAFHRLHSRIVQTVILNDTVGTLLAASYADPSVEIGSICGTGHNTCFRDKGNNGVQPMIRNLESGNFSKVSMSVYDRQLDAASEKPGEQRLEKMVGGQYLGEIVRMMAMNAAAAGALSAGGADDLIQPYCLTTADLAFFMYPALFDRPKKGPHLSVQDEKIVAVLANLVCRRSARLAAATYVGILKYLDFNLTGVHTIGVDGSLYTKLPGYAAQLQEAVKEILPERSGTVRIVAARDGSGIGAAIAAAIATRQKYFDS